MTRTDSAGSLGLLVVLVAVVIVAAAVALGFWPQLERVLDALKEIAQ